MSEQTPLRRAARLCAAAAAALLLCLAAAWLCPARADLDRIRSYTVTVDPRADGSADITYDIDWEVIGGSAEEPLSWVRIGLANGEVDSFENLTPETVSGVRYSGDGGGSFARVTFKKRYYPPDYAAASGQESRVQFAFRVHQSQLYTPQRGRHGQLCVHARLVQRFEHRRDDGALARRRGRDRRRDRFGGRLLCLALRRAGARRARHRARAGARRRGRRL